MRPFIQHPDELTYIHEVPFVVWCYWEGAEMQGNRRVSFEYLQKNIGVPICLITPANLTHFIKPGYPFPKEYPALSIVHRSDYVRAYLMHHYGGAWHDIKATEVSYARMWDKFADPNIWIIGKPEVKGGSAKITDDKNRFIPDYYQDLIAVPSWIARGNTDFSRELVEGIANQIHIHASELLKHPAKHPREKKIPSGNILKRVFNILKFNYQKRSIYYPLEWTLFGNIFHPLILEYKAHVNYELPFDAKKNAGIYHRG